MIKLAFFGYIEGSGRIRLIEDCTNVREATDGRVSGQCLNPNHEQWSLFVKLALFEAFAHMLDDVQIRNTVKGWVSRGSLS